VLDTVLIRDTAQTVARRAAPGRRPGTGLALSLMLFMALHALFMSVIPTVGDSLRAEFSLSASQIGLLTSLFMVAFAVGSIPMGVLGSRWGGKVLLAGAGVMALGAVLFAFSGSYPWFLAGRFLQGIGASAILPVVNMLISQVFPPPERAKSLGLFGAGLGVGVVAALLCFPSLAAWAGYKAVFLVAAGAAVTVGLVNLAQPAVRHHSPVQEPQSFSVLVRRSMHLALNRRLLLLVVVNIGASGIIVGLVAWTPSFLHDMRGSSLAVAAYVSAGIGVAQLIGNLLGARAMTRWGKGAMYVVSLAAMAVSAALIPIVPSLGASLVFIVAAGFFSMAVFPAIMGGVPDTVDHDDDIGPATGLLNFTNMVGTLLAPWLFGVLLDAFGTGPQQSGFKSGYLLLALFALFGIIGGVALTIAWHRTARDVVPS
jgi:MFS transporter, ACS family, hexuronate transporter